jgi:Coenzyme PQQ synthesis protein D (PqqD)
MTTLYSRHADLRLTAVEDEGVVLHLGSLRYFTVNETGLVILQELLQPRTIDELVKAVTEAYDVSDDLAEQTTREFLTRCVEAKLLHTEDR